MAGTITEENIARRANLVASYNKKKTKDAKARAWAEIEKFEAEMLEIGQNG